MRYRTKPTYVEAVQWDGSDEQAIALGLEKHQFDITKTYWWSYRCHKLAAYWNSVIRPTDWIITQEDGTSFNISNLRFEMEYEPDTYKAYQQP